MTKPFRLPQIDTLRAELCQELGHNLDHLTDGQLRGMDAGLNCYEREPMSLAFPRTRGLGILFETIAEAKRFFVKRGVTACEVCGWSAPAPLVRYSNPLRLLHVHHVIPIAAGGEHWEETLAVLCLNCHRLAHAIWATSKGAYAGPIHRDTMIQELKIFLLEPEKWWEIRRNLTTRGICKRSTTHTEPHPKAGSTCRVIDQVEAS